MRRCSFCRERTRRARGYIRYGRLRNPISYIGAGTFEKLSGARGVTALKPRGDIPFITVQSDRDIISAIYSVVAADWSEPTHRNRLICISARLIVNGPPRCNALPQRPPHPPATLSPLFRRSRPPPPPPFASRQHPPAPPLQIDVIGGPRGSLSGTTVPSPLASLLRSSESNRGDNARTAGDHRLSARDRRWLNDRSLQFARTNRSNQQGRGRGAVDNNRLPGRVSQFVGQNEYPLSIFGLCCDSQVSNPGEIDPHVPQISGMSFDRWRKRGGPSVAWNLILPLDEIHSPTDRTPPSSIPFSESLDSPRVGREAEGGGNN